MDPPERQDLPPARPEAEAAPDDPGSTASGERSVDLDEVIDAVQAAHLLGVGREHVVKLLQRGLLPGKRLTGTWVTTRRAVEAYARSRRPRGRPRSQPE